MNKLRWIVALIFSRSYVIMLDNAATVYIPLIDPDSFKSRRLLVGQANSLREFKSQLDDVIKEHERAVKQLSKKK